MPYVDPKIIADFKGRHGPFNYKKLIKLLEQLDYNYDRGQEYACYLLIKAILNHIPPLLGQPTFEVFVAQHRWSSAAHKKYAEFLNNIFIEETHDATHTRISSREDQLSLGSVTNAKVQFNTILEEARAHTVSAVPVFTPPPAARRSKTEITLAEPDAHWANFGGWPSFQIHLLINNYENPRPNYIDRVALRGNYSENKPYLGTEFQFHQQKVGERLRIESYDKLDTVVLARAPEDRNSVAPHPLPDIDTDSLVLTLYLADGTETELPIRRAVKQPS